MKNLFGIGLAVLVLAMVASPVSAATMTTIMSSSTGSDGHSQLAGTEDSTLDIMRVGFPNSLNQYLAQVYFIIPAELKAPGVVITSASLVVEPTSGGVVYQMVHLNYDTGLVSAANAFATNNAANYTKVGGFGLISSWDVTSVLAADIVAANTYLPIVIRITDSSGNFIADGTSGVIGNAGAFWSSERLPVRSTPKLTIDYTVPEPATMLLLGIGGLVLRRRIAA